MGGDVPSAVISPESISWKSTLGVSCAEANMELRLLVPLRGMAEGLNCLAILGGDCAEADVAHAAASTRAAILAGRANWQQIREQ
jgi:hypothetical protein